jgi:hypothetical protein
VRAPSGRARTFFEKSPHPGATDFRETLLDRRGLSGIRLLRFSQQSVGSDISARKI